MTLEKLTITPFKKNGNRFERDLNNAIKVLFNPNTYTITKSVTWNPPITRRRGGGGTHGKVNAPTLSFGGGGSRHLTLELFFDVTEPVENGDGQSVSNTSDVRKRTDKIVALTRIDRALGQPPVCEVMWGQSVSKDFPFVGVVSNLTQRFTLFRESGNPVRAILTVDFLEFLDPTIDKRQTDPENTTHIIKISETLSSISGDVYQDPTIWRVIADANRLDDPRKLVVGKTLTIPRLSRR